MAKTNTYIQIKGNYTDMAKPSREAIISASAG